MRNLVPVLIVSMLLAGAAQAGGSHVYPLLSGVWARGDGIDVDVPFVGKRFGNCDFLVQGYNRDRPMGDFATMFPTTPPTGYGGFMTKVAANYGCLSGHDTNFAADTHALGAGFTLPTNLVSRPIKGPIAVPIPGNDSLVQAETDALWLVPNATRGMGEDALGAMTAGGFGTIGPQYRLPQGCMEASCTNLAEFRRFEANAWANQTGRAGASFTWCPGDATETTPCTTINQNDYNDGRIIKYKAGGLNAFGGTIAQIVETVAPGNLFIKLPTGNVIVNILDAGSGAIQALGRGYADFLTDNLPAGTMGFTMVTEMKHYKLELMKSVTLITMVGVPVGGAFPPNINEKYGFPLTTGTVVARNTTTALGDPVITITGMGYDKLVTPSGAESPSGMTRNISLVAGSLSNLSNLGTNTVGMGQLFLSMPEPGRGGQLLAGVAGLLVVAAWRARRERSGGRS